MVMVFAMPSVVFANNAITQQDIDEAIALLEEYPVRLLLDGEEIAFSESDMSPIIINERTLIPARALFEAMDGNVEWDEERQEVVVSLGDSLVVLTVDSNIAWVDGAAQTLEVPAMIIARPGEVYGNTMIPVRFTVEALGSDVDWDELERTVLVTSPFIPEDENTEENTEVNEEENEAKEEDEATNGEETANSDIQVPAGFAPLGRMNEAAAQRLIFIDIGHGGRDPGTTGDRGGPNELHEKVVNLKVGLYLRDFLNAAGANFRMSRETDIHIPTADRAYMANDLGADLFVSIHNNASSTNLQARGTEVLFYSKVDEDGRTEGDLFGIYSRDVAERVQREMVSALGTFDRGTREAPRLIVLNRTVMPAIVIEGAFLSNREDLALIRSDDYAKRYAYAVAKALIEVMNETFK